MEMMSSTLPVITDADRRRLGSLLTTPAGRAWGTSRTVADLESILDDAPCVPAREVDSSVVTMDTTVRLVDPETGARRTVTLVYPEESGDWRSAVSVTSPLGVALLGSSAGDVIQCREKSTDGRWRDRRWRIEQIIYQPERAWAALH